MYLGRQTITKR